MTKTPLLLCLALAVAPGCLFSRKSAKPRENQAISMEVAETFRKRWVDKRVADLVAGGTAADAARTQAEAEFRERYDLSPLSQKR